VTIDPQEEVIQTDTYTAGSDANDRRPGAAVNDSSEGREAYACKLSSLVKRGNPFVGDIARRRIIHVRYVLLNAAQE
jgi:hypothetical protein